MTIPNWQRTPLVVEIPGDPPMYHNDDLGYDVEIADAQRATIYMDADEAAQAAARCGGTTRDAREVIAEFRARCEEEERLEKEILS